MNYFRAWLVLTLAWAATSLLLAPMIADALWNDNLATVVFFWLLLVVAALLPLAHEFIHRQRPYRRAILIMAIGLAALLAYSLAGGWRTRDMFWMPIAWVCVLGFSDWLFTKVRQFQAKATPLTNQNVKEQLRGYAKNNIDRALYGFDENANEFKKVFLDERQQGERDIQLGPVSLKEATDVLAITFGMEAALAAFYIVFQRVYDDPRQSEAFLQLRQHLSKKLIEISFPNQKERLPYLSEANFQKVWELVNDPKYSRKKDELRLAVAMIGLFVGTNLKPPLVDEKDRETLMLLTKRTLNRMRACLQKQHP